MSMIHGDLQAMQITWVDPEEWEMKIFKIHGVTNLM